MNWEQFLPMSHQPTEKEGAMSKAGSRILESDRQALAYAEGNADVNEYGVHIPAELDVKSIRAKVEMSQGQFAGHFGVSKRTV